MKKNDKKEAAKHMLEGIETIPPDYVCDAKISVQNNKVPKKERRHVVILTESLIAVSAVLILSFIIWGVLKNKKTEPENKPIESSTFSENETENNTENNKATDLPPLSEVATYSFDQMYDLSNGIDENTLIQMWGEPFKTGYQRIWSVEIGGKTKYVEAFVQNGEVGSLNNSVAMYAVVAKKDNGETYCFLDYKDYILDRGKLCHLPQTDVYGNAIECEVGDRLLIECNGIIVEKYPGDIEKPYKATFQGKVSAEDMKKIESELNSSYVLGE